MLAYEERVFHLVFIFSMVVSPFLSAQTRLQSLQACHRIQALYSSCGDSLQIVDDHLVFTLAQQQQQISVPCSDGLQLDFYDRMEKMDVVSLFMIPYDFGAIALPEVRKNHDPGRLRLESLNRAIFGNSEQEVQTHLVKIYFLTQEIEFQSKLGAANQLEQVSRELIDLATVNPEVKKFLTPFITKKYKLDGMTFKWRNIAGTNRLSAHSFATAIDLLTAYPAQYWLWDEEKIHPEKAKLGEVAYKYDHYIPSQTPYVPIEIVKVFEKHGFIWGGKWNHYDTMHFEYRPEFNPEISSKLCK